jgi:CRISPR system Cascade subunit CasC
MRLHMRDVQGLPTGSRTRRLAEQIARTLEGHGRDRDEAFRSAQAALRASGFTFDEDRTTVGLYLAADEVERLAAAVDRDWNEIGAAKPEEPAAGSRRDARKKARDTVTPAVKEAVESVRDRVSAVDIALFGRMVAENAYMNVDAACQVAHALSTHPAEVEMDFFTAVDDLRKPDEEPGAGMMGIVEYNSACFYRYALIQRPHLLRNLSGDRATADRGIVGFARAALEAVPTGRQNSSAAQNPVDYVQVYVGEGRPANLANAFERPVAQKEGRSLTGQSVAALWSYQQRLERMYEPRPGETSWATTVGSDEVPGVEGAVTVPELLSWLEARLQGAD